MGADAPAGDDTAREATAKPEKKKHFCSFCTKSQDDVKLLIAATNAWICNECISLCVDLLKDHQVEPFSNSREAKLGFLLETVLKEVRMSVTARQSQLRDEQEAIRTFAEKIAVYKSQQEKLPSPDYDTEMVIFTQER